MIDKEWGAVLSGGIAAGLVIAAGEAVLNGLLLASEWDAAMRSLGRPPLGPPEIVLLNVMSLFLGVATVAIYAATRSPCRSDRATAVRAGLLGWFLAYAIGLGWSFAMNVFSATLYVTTLAWSSIEIPAATLAGAWVYGRRERSRAA